MFSDTEPVANSTRVSLPFDRKGRGGGASEQSKSLTSNPTDIAIQVQNVSKCYQIYEKPNDRLKQFIAFRLQRLLRQPLKQYFREFWALKDVSFAIRKGETFGILGQNGSGKSTLLQIICGTLSSTTGEIQVNGRIAALLELGAGFNPEFTGRENVVINAAILGMAPEEIDQRFDEIVNFSELGEFIDQPVKTYSSGMYVRLAFSIAINASPAVLIVDEALSVGDARFQAKCMHRIKEIQESGATILFVSHDVSAVRALCQQAIWLDHGRIRAMGDVFPITGQYMEYMCSDNNQLLPTTTLSVAEAENESAERIATEGADILIDKRPITHWGSHVGIIHSAGIFDLNNNRANVIHWNEEVAVRIVFKIPNGIALNHLSASFSIKDISGTDLIVSTTHDQHDVRFTPTVEGATVEFRFFNFLVTGKYLLVAAIEDRSSSTIHYYEYIEGAHYFSSLANNRYFGIFQPKIRQSLL